MHHLLMGYPLHDLMWDHDDTNGLSNRRSKLRLATKPQNQWNIGKRNGRSRFKWVSWNRRNGKWQAALTANRKPYFVGCFDNEVEAARAANEIAGRSTGCLPG